MENKFDMSSSTAEEESRRWSSQSSQPQPPQMQSSQFHQPESSRHGFLNRDFDLQTLESSFGRLSFADSSSSRLNQYHQMINGGAVGVGGGVGVGGDYGGRVGVGGDYGEYMDRQSFYAKQRESIALAKQRLLYENDCVNQLYGFNTNGILNGVSYTSRNRVSVQNPWYSSNGFNRVSADQNPWDYYSNGFGTYYEGFGYNHDQVMRSSPAQILWMCRDQVWREHVKRSISHGSIETIDVIFKALIFHICDLMIDHYAIDVVQMLLDKCNSEQIIQIVDMVTHDQIRFQKLCSDALGTTAIQTLLHIMKDRCEEDQILRIVGAISILAVEFAKNTYAKYVIIRCFSEFTYAQCRNLVEAVARNCYEIAIDRHGCCLLQLCFDSTRMPNDEIRQHLIFKTIAHAFALCSNCYGNYVVQYIVELDNQRVIEALVKQLLGSYANLARSRYASHVVQKLLNVRSCDTKLIVLDMLREIDTLLLDPFGNYVIQTAWFVSKDDVRHMLRWHIERNIRLMRCNKFGNKILEKLNL